MDQIIKEIRKDFPTLVRHDQGIQPVHYLDNAATALKPATVLEAMQKYYVEYPANIHRGSYSFSQKASDAYETAREKVAKFLHVKDSKSIVFTGGTTIGNNMFIHSFLTTLKSGDEVIISELEHHANLVSWKSLAPAKGVIVKMIPFNPKINNLDIAILPSLITPATKLISVSMASNTLGVITPYKEIIAQAKAHSIPICLDIAQMVTHQPVDLQALDVDFAFFSGHKLFGPTGVGVFYGKVSWLEKLPPFSYGGGMVSQVSREQIRFSGLPEKMEAGTPPIAQAIGLGAAIDYLNNLGFDTLIKVEDYLIQETMSQFAQHPEIVLYTQKEHYLPIFSFNIQDVNSHDVATILDEHHIAVRTGQHCTHILLSCMDVSSTVRASFGFYNNKEDVRALFKGINAIKEIFYV